LSETVTRYEEIETIPTGIVGLDKIIGGFIKGRTYLVAGEAGTGKTIFSLNFLMGGIRRGEDGIYVLVEGRVKDLLTGAKSFGWNLEELANRGLLSVMTLSPEFSERFRDRAAETMARSVVKDIGSEVKKINAKRLVIDPIAPSTLGEDSTTRVRGYIRELIYRIEQDINITTVITSEVPAGSNALSRFGVEEFLASGVIVLGLRKEFNRYIRTIHIRKMKWLPVHPSTYRFEIVPKIGIVIKERIE